MGIRDVLLTAFVFGVLPFALVRPVIGVLLWTWLGLMNPHRLTYGFAHDFKFALIVACVTLLGLVLTRDERRWPVSPPTVVLMAFLMLMTLGIPFSFFPGASMEMWNKVMKIQLMTFVAVALIVRREQIQWFVWVLVLSIGFFGVKGGIYTLVGGGEGRVLGPSGSYIEGNNEMALALIMVIPLMWYLFETHRQAVIRAGLALAAPLTTIAALGSQSRGALLAIGAMAVTFWWYSKRKVALGLAIVVLLPAMIAFMPAVWDARMATIVTYETDNSAMGRIYAWQTMFNLALHRPLFGGGFESYNEYVFGAYSPSGSEPRAAHSIYFQVMGEHGFAGLALFLLIWFFTWRTATWIRRNTRADGDNAWAFHLASMAKVSLVGYFVGGAFLSLAYFDLPYDIMAALVCTQYVLRKQAQSTQAAAPPSHVLPGGAHALAQASEPGMRPPDGHVA
jgi:probable O-glycosylation ligase (exosortase A-associated)